MIFKEITMINFRQYRGEHTFGFPKDNERKITLLIARNGVGKTTFLQAFRFCFYGENQGALKLPKSEELITNSLDYVLNYGEQAPVTVRVKFEHAGRNFIAKRTIMFQKGHNGLQKIMKSQDQSFELLEEDATEGIVKIENGEKRINEIMPIGLAHIYMFDGERVEMPISSREFQHGLRTSIVGVLGLEKLQKSYDFLGSKERRNSVIGKTWLKMQSISNTEQAILDREKQLLQLNEQITKEIKDKERAIQSFNKDIEKGRAAQASIDEFKAISNEVKVKERNVQLKQVKIKNQVRDANNLATELLFKLKIAKLYAKFKQFINSADDTQEIYENLYSSVIDDILKSGNCICGRPVQQDDEFAKHLKKLITLPQDNASYLNNLIALFKSLDDMPAIRSKINKYNTAIMNSEDELEVLQKEQDNAEQKLKDAENKRGGVQNQINIEKIRQYKASFEHDVQVLRQNIEDNDRELAQTKGKINKIKFNNANNIKVSEAVEMLEILKNKISLELEKKKKIARESIQRNMNTVLRGITDQRYADFQVELDTDYQLTVYKHIPETDEYEDTTDILSTGENVVMYLSFLRGLLLTINQHAEFSDISQNGVIMDAALSNLDEEHIRQISTRILTNFDQLIFLSYKGQLRNELITGIKDSVAKVYELTKNESGDIEQSQLSIKMVEEYVNKGEDE